MKKIFLPFFLIITTFTFLFFSKSNVKAVDYYNLNQVSQHNTPDDCWMVIRGDVYDFTDYLSKHEDKLDIKPWCGKEATQDYNTKAGKNESHSVEADQFMANYKIGVFLEEEINLIRSESEANKKYNIIVPVLITVLLFLISQKLFSKTRHSFIWNTLLLIGLIPSLGFGMIMSLIDQFPWLENLYRSDMLKLHVEFSAVFGTIMVLHFLQRIQIYLMQGKASLKKIS